MRILIILMLLVGCDDRQPPTKVTKVIAEKLAVTEQRLDYDLFDSKNHFRSRATTVYYLIADDGSTLEVGLKEYAKLKPGNRVTSSKWSNQ